MSHLSADFGDGSCPAGTLVPWYRKDDPTDWLGWEICEEAAGFLGQDRWIINRWGQTTMGVGPFQARIIEDDGQHTTGSLVIATGQAAVE